MRQLKNPIIKHDSRAELNEFLFNSQGSLILGADAESPRRFYSVEVYDTLCIGIISSYFGINPSVLVDDDFQIAFIGCDFNVSIVDIEASKIKASLTLDGVFYEFLNMPDDINSVIVLHELGVIRIDAEGTSIWNISTDIVEGHEIIDGNLSIQIMGKKEPVIIDIVSGKRR